MNTRLPGVLVIGALAGLLACSSSTKKEKVLELIAVTPASPSLAQGAQQQLTATGKYSDGSTQDLTASVTWASLDTTVATVSAGLVIAGTVTAGSAVVTATLADQVGFTEVTVTGSQLAIIRLSSPSVKVPAGVAVGLVAMGEYTDGSERNLSSVATWGSAAPETATVAGGAVTGVAAGDTTVTATVGDLTAAATVTVTSAILQSIVIAPGNAPTVAPGRTEAFSAFGTYDDLSVVDLTEAVTWVSSDPTIASISNDAGTRGQATSLLAGSTDVTAALGAVTSAAQPLTVADAATDYVESRTPFAWTDMTGSTFVVVGDDEEAALPAVDGFSFTFYGTAYTTDQIHASTNGVLFFGGGSTNTSDAAAIPSALTPNGFVAAHWVDLVTSVTAKVVGTAPTRELVVEWNGGTYDTSEPVRFQAVLGEGTNTVDFRYLLVAAQAIPTIGVEDQTGTVGTQHSRALQASVPGLSLRFGP